MKVLKIVLISIFVLIFVAVAAALIFIKTFDVMRFKPQIIEQANKALSRQVDFERAILGLSLRQGISLKIKNLLIKEDPVFRKGEFVTVKDISVGIDALSYLLQKKINVPSIIIDSPHITIIRQKDGSLNVQTIGKPSQTTNGSANPQKAPAAAPLALPALLINSLKANNGTVMYVDNSFEPAMRLEISEVAVKIDRFSLTGPFPFTIEAAVLSARKNIRIEGKAQIDLKTNGITVSELKGGTDLSQILLDEIPVSFPMAKGASLPTNLGGNLDFSLSKLTAGPKGLLALDADAKLSNGSLRMKELASALSGIAAAVKITQDAVLVEKLNARIGGGSIEASGSIKDYLLKQDYSFTAQALGLDFKELIDQSAYPVKAEGIAAAKIKINGRGFTPEAFKSGLSGNADISVTKAKLKDLNVLQTVLDKISIIPGLSEKIQAKLPERYKQKLTQKDTVLSDVNLPVTIANGQILIKNTVLGADEFLFKGNGQAGFDGAYSMEGSFLIPQELSEAMVAAVDQLQYLLNDEKQIYIPLKISGKAGAPKFNVDAEYLAKRLLENQAKQQIFKAIEKAIGGSKEQPDSQGQNATQSTSTTGTEGSTQDGSSKKSSTEEAIGSILGTIFK